MTFSGQQASFDFGLGSRSIPLVLISLGEAWHKSIVAGVKHFEYRRRYLREPSLAVVYVGDSVRGICALAELGEPIVDSPSRIAAIGEKDQPGIHRGLVEYFGSRKEGFAIPIDNYEVFDPIPLEQIKRAVSGFHPPQSYLYVDRNPTLLAFLQREAGSALLADARPG